MATVELTGDNFNDTIGHNPIVFLDFWAAWCGPCRTMAPIYERAAGELEPAVRLANVNTDKQGDLATPGDDFTPSEMVLRILPGQAAWLEDKRRESNGALAHGLVANAMGCPVSRAWKGYWQRAA